MLDRRRGIVQQFHGAARMARVALQHQGDDEAGGGDADGAGQEMLGKADQPDIGLAAARFAIAMPGKESGEGGAGALGADVAGDGILQPPGGDGGAPQLESGAASRLQVANDETRRLHTFDRGGRAHQRTGDIGREIGDEAPDHPVGERIELHGEQDAGFQKADAERASVEEAAADPAGIGKRRQQQRVDPDEKADDDAPHGAPRRGPPPYQPAEEGRRELRHRRERQQPDLSQCRRSADHPVIGVGEAQHTDDGPAADQDQGFAHVLMDGGAFLVAAQQ